MNILVLLNVELAECRPTMLLPGIEHEITRSVPWNDMYTQNRKKVE